MMIIGCIGLLLIVLLVLLYPIKQQKINFDEQADIIKIYRKQLAFIKHQKQQELIDDEEYQILVKELDKKSADLMLQAKEKPFAYRDKKIPMILLAIGLSLSLAFYYSFYTGQKVDIWQKQGDFYKTSLAKGLFDKKIIDKTLAENDKADSKNFCFLMQQKMLSKFPNNPKASINVAQCFLKIGMLNQVDEAIAYTLRLDNNHIKANYLLAELEFLQGQKLQPETQKRLQLLFKNNPNAVDIGYLLILDYFAKQEFSKMQAIAKQLQPETDKRTNLKQAIAGLMQQVPKN